LHNIYSINLTRGKRPQKLSLLLLTLFLKIGSKRVIVSFWNVKDSATYILMKNFYEKMLARGLKPSVALREAQLEMWKKGQSPYFWAAFTLQGEWR
jgi:CHAT domain-containing protein